MNDIVERARKYSPYDYEPGSQVYREARLRDELIAEIERLRALSQNNAHSWDAIVGERERLRTEIELLHAELRVTKKLGLAALQDAMRQARISKSR